MIRQVLLVDDDRAVREALGQTLELGGYSPILAGSYIEAKDHIARDFGGVIVSDIRMPGKDGFALLEYAVGIDDQLPVILLTGEGDIKMAVRGMQQGAHDFLEKPCDPKHLLKVVEKSIRNRDLVLENRRLKQDLDQALSGSTGFIGTSDASAKVRKSIGLAGQSAIPVLISGEQGSGRGHVARLILEARKTDVDLHRVDCFSPFDPETLPGDLDATLLRNIERLEIPDQARLSAFLKNKGIAHLMATTGPDPETLVQDGKLDDEFYHSIGVVRIHVPSLIERQEDIPLLFNKFMREEIDAGAPITDAEGRAALRGLHNLDWTGNLRSLRNHVKRAAWGLQAGENAPGLRAQLERVERGLIEDALRRCGGNATETAVLLGLPRKTFYDRLQKLGIRTEEFR